MLKTMKKPGICVSDIFHELNNLKLIIDFKEIRT